MKVVGGAGTHVDRVSTMLIRLLPIVQYSSVPGLFSCDINFMYIDYYCAAATLSFTLKHKCFITLWLFDESILYSFPSFTYCTYNYYNIIKKGCYAS